MLDYSAVSFPTGLNVIEAVDVDGPDYAPLSSDCRDIHATCTYYNRLPILAILYPCFDTDRDACIDEPELMHGLPISLQLVARRLEEEKVLAMTGAVLKALSG